MRTTWRAAGLMLGAALWMNAHGANPTAPDQFTVADYEKAIQGCMRAYDLDCAEKNWRQVLRLRPNDTRALANLGMLLNRRDKHDAAISLFQRAIELGEGTYDLFAYYADSLGKLGRTDEAIDWSYKSLAAFPRTVDVRGKLAKLLVAQKRYHEALGLLSAFDEYAYRQGQAAYFDGQRIAIESLLAKDASAAEPKASVLRLSKLDAHYYAPLTLGEARPTAFVVDTGASVLSLSEELLSRSKVAFKTINPHAGGTLADGRRMQGRTVSIESLRIGAYELRKVQAFVCHGCVPLLGQNALAKFDMKSVRQQGVDFMLLSPRGH